MLTPTQSSGGSRGWPQGHNSCKDSGRKVQLLLKPFAKAGDQRNDLESYDDWTTHCSPDPHGDLVLRHKHIDTTRPLVSLCQVLPGFENLLVGHSSWYMYAATMRIYKHWDIRVSDIHTATGKMSFSSYPGAYTNTHAHTKYNITQQLR